MAKDLVLKILMAAEDRASAAFARIRAAASGLSGELNDTQQELRQLNAAQRQISERNAIQAAMRATTREIMENRRALADLSNEIRRNSTASRSQEADLRRLISQRDRLTARQNEQSTRLERLNTRLREHGITARDSATAQAELDRRMSAATAQMNRQTAAAERMASRQAAMSSARDRASRLQGAAVSMGAAGVSVGMGVGHAVSAGMSEEDAMLGVIRQVQGLKNADNSLNQTEIAKVRAEIQGLSSELPMATTEIMAMYEAGARMNVPRKELADYVRTATQAATAFDAENPQELAESLGRINSNFKLTAKQGRELADVINYLDDNAISKGTDIISYMNRVSGSMGLAKISDKNTAALGSTLLTQGVDESTAAGAVSSLFTRLSTAPDMKPVKDALKGLGLDANTIQKGMVEDANATVMQVMEAVKKMPKEQQAGFLKGLAGGEYNKVFAGLISNTEEWRRQIQLANSSDAIGSMGREFETRMTAFSSKWQIFKNKLFNAESGAGQALFGTLSSLMSVAGGWLERLTAWTAKNPELAGGIMKVVAVGGALLVALSGAALAVSALLGPMLLAKFAIASLASSAMSGFNMIRTAFTALRVVMMMNPIALMVGVAVAAIYLLWSNWDKVKSELITGWNWIKKVFASNPLASAFLGPIGAIGSLIANFDRLKAAASSAWNWVKKAISGGSGGSAATPASVGVPNRGFSVGGYTGAGSVNEAAGIVHKGEVVFSQSDVSRFGGWRVVDALRRGGMNALNWARGKLGSVASAVNKFTGGSFTMPSENNPRGIPQLAGAVAVPAGFNRSGGNSNVNSPMSVVINITGGNQSPMEIAKEVERQLAEFARNTARRARSSLFDKD